MSLPTSSRFENIADTIFAETTTFGLRWHLSFRRILRREEETVGTSYGPVRVKKGFDRSGRIIKTHIEFDDVKAIADAKNIPYREALEQIKKEIIDVEVVQTVHWTVQREPSTSDSEDVQNDNASNANAYASLFQIKPDILEGLLFKCVGYFVLNVDLHVF